MALLARYRYRRSAHVDIEDDAWDIDSACGAASAKAAELWSTEAAPKYVKGRLKAKLVKVAMNGHLGCVHF